MEVDSFQDSNGFAIFDEGQIKFFWNNFPLTFFFVIVHIEFNDFTCFWFSKEFSFVISFRLTEEHNCGVCGGSKRG